MVDRGEFLGPEAVPEVRDRLVAARTSSLICLMAGLWYFVSPWAYFGVSEQPIAWSAWLVGALMVLIALARLLRPGISTPLAWINAALGVWVFVSPWVCSYRGNPGFWPNSVCVGVVVAGFSIFSAMSSKALRPLMFVWRH
ncbi:MAG: SPW repeat protein [Acidobacteriaceae bacterium]|nr:SPW repeat protein [Acidobacteriaceae bacterium]